MPAVSDTSPVLNLAIVGRLSLLREQFGEVWIPQACNEELRLAEDLPGTGVVRAAQEAKWLHVRQVKDDHLVEVLRRDLDRGEAEAIALAIEMKSPWLLIDEREGRTAAKSLGLRVTGVLGILVRARQAGGRGPGAASVTRYKRRRFTSHGPKIRGYVGAWSDPMRRVDACA